MMEKALNRLDREMDKVRAGRANPKMLESVLVDYYGTLTPISQVANINSPDPRTIAIQPWDATSVKLIEKAILASDIGITPVTDGKTIRLTFQPPTEERRKELVKQVSKLGEDKKVAIRNVRRDANDAASKMKKNGELTEDDLKAAEKKIQDVTDKYIKQVDEITAAKNKEILSI